MHLPLSAHCILMQQTLFVPSVVHGTIEGMVDMADPNPSPGSGTGASLSKDGSVWSVPILSTLAVYRFRAEHTMS